MHRAADQNDRLAHRVEDDAAASTTVPVAPADEDQHVASQRGAPTTPSAAHESRSRSVRVTPNRRVGPYYFNTDDKLGKGVYGEVFRAYAWPQSPQTHTSENPRETYEEVAVTPEELAPLADASPFTVALKRMVNPAPADGWTAATLREITVLLELGNSKNPEERALFIPHARAYYPRQGLNGQTNSRRPSMRSWSLTDYQPLTTSTTAGLSQDDDLNSFITTSGGDSSATPAQMRPLELPAAFAIGRRTQLTPAQRAVRDGARCIIELHKFMLDDTTGTAYLATEFCEGGDLHAFVRKQTAGEQRINDSALYKRWMLQIVQGVAFMHSRHISHRDLKPQNILLKKRLATEPEAMNGSETSRSNHPGWLYDLKVGDFGLARVEDIAVKKYEHEAITLGYRPPDALLGNLYLHTASDVWSLGCILLETATGQPMFRGRDDQDQLKRILVRFGGLDSKAFPSAYKYARSQQNQSLLAKLARYYNDQSAEEAYQVRFAEEMKKLSELEETCSEEFLEYTSHQEPQHVAVIRMHLRDFFERHPGLDVLGEEGLDLLSRMLMLEPGARLSLEGALAHPFFAAESCASVLDTDDQFMELHDYEEVTTHRAPCIGLSDAHSSAPQGANSSLLNPPSRPPILASRPSGSAIVSEAAPAGRGDGARLPSSNGPVTPPIATTHTTLPVTGAMPYGNGRPSASYVLPPYISQQQQRLSQSASEIKASDNMVPKANTPGLAMGGSPQLREVTSGMTSRQLANRAFASASVTSLTQTPCRDELH